MKFYVKYWALLMLILSPAIFAQSNLEVEFTVTDRSEGTENLVVGVDSSATEGLDPMLSEKELPPMPPSGIFDARLKLPTDVYSLIDLREGLNFGDGTEYILTWQLGQDADGFFIEWTLPENVGMNIQDISGSLIDKDFEDGPGELLVNDPLIRTLKLTLSGSTIVGVEENLPREFQLKQNYPNPFNPSTTIEFQVPVSSDVSIDLYNLLGQKVKELTNDSFAAGTYTINLNAPDLPSGIYIYSITAHGKDGKRYIESKKMTLIK